MPAKRKMILGEYFSELLLLFKWKNDIIFMKDIRCKNVDKLYNEIDSIDHTIFNPDFNIEEI